MFKIRILAVHLTLAIMSNKGTLTPGDLYQEPLSFSMKGRKAMNMEAASASSSASAPDSGLGTEVRTTEREAALQEPSARPRQEEVSLNDCQQGRPRPNTFFFFSDPIFQWKGRPSVQWAPVSCWFLRLTVWAQAVISEAERQRWEIACSRKAAQNGSCIWKRKFWPLKVCLPAMTENIGAGEYQLTRSQHSYCRLSQKIRKIFALRLINAVPKYSEISLRFASSNCHSSLLTIGSATL